MCALPLPYSIHFCLILCAHIKDMLISRSRRLADYLCSFHRAFQELDKCMETRLKSDIEVNAFSSARSLLLLGWKCEAIAIAWQWQLGVIPAETILSLSMAIIDIPEILSCPAKYGKFQHKTDCLNFRVAEPTVPNARGPWLVIIRGRLIHVPVWSSSRARIRTTNWLASEMPETIASPPLNERASCGEAFRSKLGNCDENV